MEGGLALDDDLLDLAERKEGEVGELCDLPLLCLSGGLPGVHSGLAAFASSSC